MKTLTRAAVLLVLFSMALTPWAGAGYERVQTPLDNDPMAVSIYRLDNGLTVYLSENPDLPRFYAEIGVRAGSKNDPPETTGLAHYFEHLMFKGSRRMGTIDFEKEKPLLEQIKALYEEHFNEDDPERRREIYERIDTLNQQAAQYAVPNELDKVYKSMGGEDINAHTWLEETVYKTSLPPNRLRQWAIIESDRFQHPVFRLFPTELETVYEEKNRSLDNKNRVLFNAVNEQLYQVHPYGQWPTLGTMEDLKNPSIRRIERFFDEWYAPNNMAIAISGDIDKAETMAVIDEYFSKLERDDLPEQRKYEEPPLEAREQVTVNFPGQEEVMLAFRTVPQNHPDAEALQILDMILDNATAGLINLNLNQRQRVLRAGSYPMQLNDYGAQYFYGMPKEGQTLEEVEQLILEQVELVKTGEFEDWIIPAIINDFKKNEKSGLESNETRARRMIDAYIAYEPWEKAVGRIARMSRITKADVVRVANKYFGGGYVVGYRVDEPRDVPTVEKPDLTPVDIDPQRRSEFAGTLLAMEVQPLEPEFVEPGKDYTVAEDPNGVTFYRAPNPLNDIFTLKISVDFGTHQDNTIAPAVELLRKSGAGGLSSEALQKEWYKLGTAFSVGAGDNETHIQLSGLDENFARSVELLISLLKAPNADAETLERLKKVLLTKRADARKDPGTVSRALVLYNRYGQDSYFLRMLPNDALKALTLEQLQQVTKRLLEYKHTVCYTGTLPMDEVRRVYSEHHPVDAPLDEPPPYRYLEARAPETTEIYLLDKELAQARIRLEFGSVEYDPALDVPRILYNDYFSGGMAGIVFQELREARALAYVAGAAYLPGYRADDQNLMVGVIHTQPDKSVEAVTAFVDLMDNLPESQARFEVAKQSLIQQYRTGKLGFREVIEAVRAWKRKGLEPDPRERRFHQLQEAELEAVLQFQQKYIAGKNKLVSIAGDTARIDMESLKKVGPLRKVALDEVFVF